jgi:hypothetical protein
MLIAALLLIGAGAPVAVVPMPVSLAEMAEPDPKKMTPAEIRAHNARLPRDHPYFIRCVRIETTGSLVPSRRASCRTNAKWAAAEEAGNQEARAVADAMRGKAMSGE